MQVNDPVIMTRPPPQTKYSYDSQIDTKENMLNFVYNNTIDSFHGPWKTTELLQLLTFVSSFCPTCSASISLVVASTAAILYISRAVSNLNTQDKQNRKTQYISGQTTFQINVSPL
jgi:hypothetical protein